MSRNASFARKVAYIGAIALLLLPIAALSQPATINPGKTGHSAGGVLAQLRSRYNLAQAELGEIDPPVFPSVERVPIGNGREVLVVSVPTGQSRPYSYRGQAYRRVGNTSPAMSRDEYNRVLLERLHAETRWENQPASDWAVSDLDEEEIRRTLEEGIRFGRVEDPGTREPEAILRGLGLMKQGALMRAAVVLFGCGERLPAEFPGRGARWRIKP